MKIAKPQKIKNVRELRKILNEGKHEFLISLKGGLVSSKYIDLTDHGKFDVYNGIDGSAIANLNGRDLYNQNITNIGKAMRTGAFVVDNR